jgi:hypothetical protein
MGNGPLTAGQLDDFVERGWTLLTQAFPVEVAQAVRHKLGHRIGVDLENPQEWTEPRVWLQEVLTIPPFTDALTDRFRAVVDQLVGTGRWSLQRHMGWWPVTFPGFDVPPYGADWHVEGLFRHHPWSPEQAVLNLFYFSTVQPGDGGTRVAEGSHHDVARLIWEAEPDGLEVDDFWPEMSKILGAPGLVRGGGDYRRGGRRGLGPPLDLSLVVPQPGIPSSGDGPTQLRHDRTQTHRGRRPVSRRDPDSAGSAVGRASNIGPSGKATS